MSDYAEIIGDSGEPAPSGSDAGETALNAGDSTAQTGDEGSQSGSDALDASITGEQDQSTEGETKIEEPAGDEPQPGEDEEITDEKIDAVLANNPNRKWFNRSVEFLRGKAATAETALKEFENFGTREDLERNHQFYDSFHGFAEKDGQLVSRRAEFVQNLFSTDRETAIEMANLFINSPNPSDPNQSIFDYLLQTPEIQQSLKAQFQTADDPVLEQIPENQREAYKSLSKEEKEEFQFAGDATRGALLRHAQNSLDIQKRDADSAREKQERETREFETAVETAQAANLGVVESQFGESLKAIPFASDPKQNAFLQHSVQDSVFTAVTMANTPAGKRASEALAAIGVTVPADTGALISKIENDSRLLQTAKTRNQAQAIRHYESEITTAQKQLLGRSNTISGAIAAYFGARERENANAKDNLLSDLPQTRPSVKGAGQGSQEVDTSGSYRDIVANG